MRLDDALAQVAAEVDQAVRLHQGVVTAMSGTLPVVTVAGATLEMVAIGEHEIGDVVQVISAGGRWIALGTVTPDSGPNLVPNPSFSYSLSGWAWDLYGTCEPPVLVSYTLTNTAEGGTAGGSVTEANSGGASGDAWGPTDVTVATHGVRLGGANDITYEAGHAAEGAQSIRMVRGSSSAAAFCYVDWKLPDADVDWLTVEVDVELTARPSADLYLWALNNFHGGAVALLRMNTNGTLRFTDTMGTQINTPLGYAIPLNQRVRISLRIDRAGNAELTIHLDPDGDPTNSYTDALTDADFDGSDFSVMKFGLMPVSTATIANTYWDRFVVQGGAS